MERLKKHTLESCKESASKYKARTEWMNNDRTSYSTATLKGWLDICCVNMVNMRNKHSLESCKEIASKYKTRTEWCKYDKNTFQSARHNKWLDEIMPKVK